MALTITLPKSAQTTAVALLAANFAVHTLGCSVVSLIGYWRRTARIHYPSPRDVLFGVARGFFMGMCGAAAFPLSVPWMVTSALPDLWAGVDPRM